MEGQEKHGRLQSENLKGREHFRDLGTSC